MGQPESHVHDLRTANLRTAKVQMTGHKRTAKAPGPGP